MKQRLLIFGLIGLVVIASFNTFVQPIRAASAGCTAAAGLSGQIFETFSRNTGSQTFGAGEVISVNVTGPGPSGETTMQLGVSGAANFNQISASPLSFTIPSDGNYTVTITNASTEDIAFVTVSCTGASSSQGSSQWSGYSDGRLNPFPAEDYSLWCGNNNLLIYRSVNGSGQLLVSVPIPTLMGLRLGGVVAAATSSGPLTIRRESADNYVVSGNNGNNAPRFGIKPFTLTECLSRNGVVPTPSRTSTRVPTRIPLPTKTPGPTLTPSKTRTYTPTPSNTPSYTPTPTIVNPNYLTGVGSLVTLLLELEPADATNDKDGDGIKDKFDICPLDPAPGQPFGCPDSDGDGVGEVLDLCPGEVGPPAARGCPDGDGDGVPYIQDLCPNFKPAADKPSAFGCLDSDGDGFPNGNFPNSQPPQPMDLCPIQMYVAGTQQVMGCADVDNDGLVVGGPLVPAWLKDNCGTDAGPDSNQGCPLGGTPPPPVVVSPAQSLFDFANQVGAFQNLTITTQSGETTCTSVNFGFCLN